MPQIPSEMTVTPGTLPDVPGGTLMLDDTILISRPGEGSGEYKASIGELLSGNRIVEWDLTPVEQPAILQVGTVPPPYTSMFLNTTAVVGNSYSAAYVAPTGGETGVMGMAKLFDMPVGYNVAFYWSPTTGGSHNKLNLLNASLSSDFTFYFLEGSGLHVQSGGYSDWTDPQFQIEDVVLIQISATGELSIKTPNMVSGVLNTITLSQGAMVAGMIDLSVTIPYGSGMLSTSDLGSGLVPDEGYLAPTTLAPAGLPEGALEKNILRVTVPGTYQGVKYAVNEAALVLDAGNGIVAPMTYESIVQPQGMGLYLVNVGPSEEHTSLSTVVQELASKGIFPKYLYVVYRGTTVANNTDINFNGLAGAVLLTDSELGNVVNSPGSSFTIVGPTNYGVLWEGAWSLGNVKARNIRLGNDLVLHTNTFDGINIECASSNAVIHAASNAIPIRIKNFGVMSNSPLDTGQYCHFFAGDGAVAGLVEFSGNCHWTTVFLHGCSLDCKGGYHSGGVQFLDAGLLAANIPNAIITIKEGATVHVPALFANISEVGVQVPYGVYLDRGVGYTSGATGDIASITNATPNVPTSNGMIFG